MLNNIASKEIDAFLRFKFRPLRVAPRRILPAIIERKLPKLIDFSPSAVLDLHVSHEGECTISISW